MNKLVITYCGCVQLLLGGLQIIDGTMLPTASINIGWLTFDGVQYDINLIFDNQAEALEYLNTTFIADTGLEGIFSYNPGLVYTNPENFTNGEIMIVYGLKALAFKIGPDAPAITLEGGYDGTFANGRKFSHPELLDLKEVQVRVGSIDSAPLADENGHTYTSVDPDDPTMGTIEFPYDIENENLFITLTQKPA